MNKIDFSSKVKGKNSKSIKVITMINWKGGSTKTTSSLNLAYSLSTLGKKILLIDTDQQTNLTQCFGIKIDEEKNFAKAFVERQDIREYIRKTIYSNIDIVTSHPSLKNIETHMSLQICRERMFLDTINSLIKDDYYDFVIVDTGASLGNFNTSILLGTDYVIIPLETCVLGGYGLIYLSEFIDNANSYGANLSILGVLFSRVDKRLKINKNIMTEIKNHFGSTVFNTYISERKEIRESQLAKQPLAVYKPDCDASIQYMNLAKEVIDRIKIC